LNFFSNYRLRKYHSSFCKAKFGISDYLSCHCKKPKGISKETIFNFTSSLFKKGYPEGYPQHGPAAKEEGLSLKLDRINATHFDLI
jgi:hypothetical protein